MKKYFSKIAILGVLAISLSATANAQLRVSIRPSITVHSRPPRPSHNHVWIAGEWTPARDRYDYKEGYWAERPRNHRVYVQGYWARSRGQYYWVPGHWQ